MVYETVVRLKHTLWYTLIETEAKFDLNHSCHSCGGTEYITNVNANLCQIEPGIPMNTVSPKHYSLVNSVSLCTYVYVYISVYACACTYICIHVCVQHVWVCK